MSNPSASVGRPWTSRWLQSKMRRAAATSSFRQILRQDFKAQDQSWSIYPTQEVRRLLNQDDISWSGEVAAHKIEPMADACGRWKRIMYYSYQPACILCYRSIHVVILRLPARPPSCPIRTVLQNAAIGQPSAFKLQGDLLSCCCHQAVGIHVAALPLVEEGSQVAP